MTHKSSSRLLAIAILIALTMATVGSVSLLTRPNVASGAAGLSYDQIVVVAMENKNLNDVYLSANAPYENGLNQGVATHWQSVTNPSQPNYIAVIGGSTFGVSGDGNHPQLNKPTIVDILENTSRTWKALAEDATGSACTLHPPRGEDHFPFLSYVTITNVPARCNNLMTGTTADVIAQVNAGTNFIWYTPNDCHNTHDCSVNQGDSWLSQWVPSLLSAMQGKRAFLLLWWDEAYTSPPYMPLFMAGPVVKTNFVSANGYVHYSLLKSVETNWGGGSLNQGDVAARDPSEFFTTAPPPTPDFSLTATPSSVSFQTGGSKPSTLSLNNMNGFTGTVALTSASVPAGVSTTCAPTSISGAQTSVCTMSSSIIGTYTVTITGTSGSLVHTAPISVFVTAPPPPPGSRDPLKQPFLNYSIWNLPIGASAVYINAGIQKATQWGMTTDQDILILNSSAPITPVYFNSDGWSGGTRCTVEGGVLFSAPIPTGFVVPGASPGDTPNHAVAILGADGSTLYQGQPFTRCTASSNATIWWFQTNEQLKGTGNSGGHGGSMLSSVGGTLRLGELVPGGVIPHALKVQLSGINYYGGLGGFRWPATTADSCAPGCYGGTIPAMRMGSLIALPASLNISNMGFETDAAKILAKTFQNYGAYVVDNAGWSVYGIDVEFSPPGNHVEDQFQAKWGYSMTPQSRTVPWARDMDRIFQNLSVVDNWDSAKWTTVSQSSGGQGSGGGAPRVPWAAGFAAPPANPLKLSYDMETLSAGKMKDFSGLGNDGTLTGTTDYDGRVGRARMFNGIADGIQSPSMSKPTNGTIALWVRPDSSQAPPPGGSYPGVAGWVFNTGIFIQAGTGKPYLQIEFPVAGTKAVVASTALSSTSFQHIAGTWSWDGVRTTMRIYINGVESGTPTLVSDSISTVPAVVKIASTALPFKGTVDEVRIYADTESASNISVLANPPILTAGFTWTISGLSASFSATASNGTPPLTFLWTFGDGASGTGSAIVHAYLKHGIFTVILSVTDASYYTVYVVRQVTVA